MLTDAHLVLKVGAEANFSEIRAAYRKLALQFHPDKGGNKDEPRVPAGVADT